MFSKLEEADSRFETQVIMLMPVAIRKCLSDVRAVPGGTWLLI
jgi:hypothetical protein